MRTSMLKVARHGGGWRLLVTSLALVCLDAWASDDRPQALPAEQETVAVAAAEARGRAVFEHDRAAAVATDAALSQRRFRRDRRVRGWLTEARSDGIAVTFIDQTPKTIYRVMVSPTGEAAALVALETPEPLSPYETGAATARAAALEVSYQPCAKSYNTVVLPPEEGADGIWTVYLLPGTTRHDTVPIGGTYRVEVDNGAVVSQRPFTRSCIALERGRGEGAMMIRTYLKIA